MDQTLVQAGSLNPVHARPILLDKSIVPRGQMLPVRQDQFLSALFQIMEDHFLNKPSASQDFTSSSFRGLTCSQCGTSNGGSLIFEPNALWGDF